MALSKAFLDTPWSFKAQYQEADTDWTTATVTGDTSAKQWGIGADYKLNSQTKLFASAVQREWDNKRTSAGAATAIPNADESVYGLGMEIKF